METFRNKPIKKHSQNPFKNNEGIKNCKKKKKKKKILVLQMCIMQEILISFSISISKIVFLGIIFSNKLELNVTVTVIQT